MGLNYTARTVYFSYRDHSYFLQLDKVTLPTGLKQGVESKLIFTRAPYDGDAPRTLNGPTLLFFKLTPGHGLQDCLTRR